MQECLAPFMGSAVAEHLRPQASGDNPEPFPFGCLLAAERFDRDEQER